MALFLAFFYKVIRLVTVALIFSTLLHDGISIDINAGNHCYTVHRVLMIIDRHALQLLKKLINRII